MIKYIRDIDNIVTLQLNMSDGDKNIINYDLGDKFIPVIDQLLEDKKNGKLRGVIITSAKRNFLSGGEPIYLFKEKNPSKIFKEVEQLKGIYRRFEKLQVPVVAAINGDAKGPGFEFLLGCNYRIAHNNPSISLGLMHTSYGLIPGGGGIVRLLWLMGVEKAYPLLVDGRLYAPLEALQHGLIDALATNEDDLMFQARQFIFDNPSKFQKWDELNAKIPKGTLKTLRVANFVTAANANLTKETYNKYPAKQAILNVLVEACAVDFDTALRIESRIFTEIVLDNTSKNMVNAFWKDTKYIEDGNNKPKGFDLFIPKKLGVVGAGYIGSGIALVSAVNGLEVLLKDVSIEAAQKGLDFCRKEIDKLINNGRILSSDKEKYLERIKITDQYEDFVDCDIVIEAVFENLQLKYEVNIMSEKYLSKEALFASATSSLSVTELSKKSNNVANFIGIRFFAPVTDTKIVEVIKGANSSEKSIAKAFDYVRKLEKLPIVVNDKNGFFTSRIKYRYIEEGLLLLSEGNSPATIEHAARFMGMPIGPLQEADLLLELYSEQIVNPIAKKVIHTLLANGRKGKSYQNGFYDYEGDEKIGLWKDLVQFFPYQGSIGIEDIQKRLVFVQVLEALHCFEDGVIDSIEEVNIATIYGDGFAPFKGGMFQYLVDYGLESFITDFNTIKERYGDRFDLGHLFNTTSKCNKIFE